MKTKGLLLIFAGLLGIIFVCVFDILAGKPTNDITGPRSFLALGLCALFILGGVSLLFSKPKK